MLTPRKGQLLIRLTDRNVEEGETPWPLGAADVALVLEGVNQLLFAASIPEEESEGLFDVGEGPYWLRPPFVLRLVDARQGSLDLMAEVVQTTAATVKLLRALGGDPVAVAIANLFSLAASIATLAALRVRKRPPDAGVHGVYRLIRGQIAFDMIAQGLNDLRNLELITEDDRLRIEGADIANLGPLSRRGAPNDPSRFYVLSTFFNYLEVERDRRIQTIKIEDSKFLRVMRELDIVLGSIAFEALSPDGRAVFVAHKVTGVWDEHGRQIYPPVRRRRRP